MDAVVEASVVAAAWANAVQPFIVWDILNMALAALTVTGAWNVFGAKR